MFTQIEQMLISKFGCAITPTSVVMDYIESLGHKPANFYHDVKDKYSIGRGKLQFIASEDVEYEERVVVPVIEETEEEIGNRIAKRFRVMDTMTKATAHGVNRAFIVSGPAGLGKQILITV